MRKLILITFLLFGYFNLIGQDKSEILKKAHPEMIFEKKPSIISIPLDISVDDLEKQINAGIPDLIFEDNSFEGDDLKLKVWRKGELIFTDNSDGVLTYEVPLRIWALKKVTVLGISHEPSTTFEVKIKFSSKFNITSKYELETKTNGISYTWITKPSLKVGFVDVPITPIIGRVITDNFKLFSSQIDETIKKEYSLKPYIIEAWNTAKQPLQVSEEYNTWVIADPVEAYITPFKSVGESIKSTVGIKVFIETYVGTPDLKILEVKDVPRLRRVEYIPEEFEIQLMNVISYDEATIIAKRMFVGEEMEFRNGRYKITVTDIVIRDNGERLELDIFTIGSFNGNLTITGLPVYVAEKEMVMLEDVKLSVRTSNILHKAASWLLRGNLTSSIEKDFGLPVNEIIDFSREHVHDAINSEFSKGIRMQGQILSITPDKVLVSEDGILALVNTRARVQLAIRGM